MSSKPSTRATPWAIVALVAVGGLGLYFAVVSTGPLPIDTGWRSAVLLEPSAVSFTVAAFLAEIGSVVGVAACGAIAAALLFAIRCGREAAQLITALLLGSALSEGAKLLVDRPRPIDSLYSFDGSSFPSGHSMGAAALAFSLAFAVSSMRREREHLISRSSVTLVWIAATAWTLSMMWSRTALGVHWLTDVVAGAAIGLSSAVISQRIWGRRVPA